MCIPCPVHTVFTPADPSTRAPGLCTSCGPNTVFFPGATPDVTGPSVPGPGNTTGFAVAVLRRDNRTIEAHMTPQKLTVNVSNTSSVSAALARGLVCPPQMAWEGSPSPTAGTFVLTLPCRGLTWRGYYEQHPLRFSLLRTRGTCEACPAGTFRREEDATCMPMYDKVGACRNARIDLRLDTNDTDRPVARWNSMHVDIIQAFLAHMPEPGRLNCSCAPGLVVRYVPILCSV